LTAADSCIEKMIGPLAVALILTGLSSHSSSAECSAPQVASPSTGKLDVGRDLTITFSSHALDGAARPITYHLAVIAREPEGRQLARAEAIVSAEVSTWRPALSDKDMSRARRIKLIYELQADCGAARSSITRHQLVIDTHSACELSSAPSVSIDSLSVTWPRQPDATGYEVCLQRAGRPVSCTQTTDSSHALEERLLFSDLAAVTPLCRRGVGLSSVVRR
jgi:hypothetical protein